MQQAQPIPIRIECPPGACVCERERLDAPGADRRILMLTREEEKKLVARIEAVSTYDDLLRLGQRMTALLGITLHIGPGANEVRTVRGFDIRLAEMPGLCRKTSKEIPAAVRRCLEHHPDIAFAILDAHDLFAQAPIDSGVSSPQQPSSHQSSPQQPAPQQPAQQQPSPQQPAQKQPSPQQTAQQQSSAQQPPPLHQSPLHQAPSQPTHMPDPHQ